MPIHNTNVVNPSAGHYTYGSGYGVAQNKYHKPRNTGDIYSPKSKWDKMIQEEEYENSKKLLSKNDLIKAFISLCMELNIKIDFNKVSAKNINKDAKFQTKAFSSHFQSANDSMPHYDKFSNVGAAGAGHTTINAGHKLSNKEELLLKETIKNLIIEMGPVAFSFNGAKNTGSGNSSHYVRKNTLGSGMFKNSSMGAQVKRSRQLGNTSDGVKGNTIYVEDCEECGSRGDDCYCDAFNFQDDYVVRGTQDYYRKLDVSNVKKHHK